MMVTFYRFSIDDFWLPYHLLPTVWVLSPFTTLQQICRSPSLTPSARTLIVGTSSSWIQPPPPRVAPFLLPFGATYTKFSNFPPDDSGRLRLTPQHPGPRRRPRAPCGKPLSQAEKLCSSLQSWPCCARLADCLQRGRAKQGYFEC